MSDVDWKRVGELLAEGVREQFEEAGRLILANAPEPLPDPTVPHGYPSWKDYCQALLAERAGLDAEYETMHERFREIESECFQLSEDNGQLLADNERLRAERSNMRRELRRLNTSMRAAKLELEVLRGRNRQVNQLEHELRLMAKELDLARAVSQTKTWVGETLPDVIRPVDGFRMPDNRTFSVNDCSVCRNPACEERGGKH